MYICLNHRCKAVFEENDIVETVIDHHPYGEGYAAEYGCVCPCCGSIEISEAFRCSRCGEYYPVDERHWHPTEEKELCADCLDRVENEVESPYSGITDMFSIFPAMLQGA